MSSAIFRKVALDRLSSPEQLDLLMRVTSPRSWLAFLGLAILVATAVYWGIFGYIPLQQSAPAALITTGGIKNIVGVDNGQLYAWHVEPGQIVTKNQIIAEILPLGQETPIPVRSLYDGRILSLSGDIGQIVQAGDSLANLQFVGPDVRLEAILYLAPEQARQLEAGMPVIVEPVSAANIGPLFGTIDSIGDFPVSAQQINQLLGSHSLSHNLFQAEYPIEVRVLLETEGAADQLPPGLIGTIASATVQMGTQRPVELVLPLR
jgi:hypothetical protein